MLSYSFYKVVHLGGLFILFLSLGALYFRNISGQVQSKKFKAVLYSSHGISLFLILLGGFGLLARTGIISGWPTWVWVKIAIWVFFAASIAAAKKEIFVYFWPVFITLGIFGAYLANYKPF